MLLSSCTDDKNLDGSSLSEISSQDLIGNAELGDVPQENVKEIEFGEVEETEFPFDEIRINFDDRVIIEYYDGEYVLYSVLEMEKVFDLYVYRVSTGESKLIANLPIDSWGHRMLTRDNCTVLCLSFLGYYELFSVKISQERGSSCEKIYEEKATKTPYISLCSDGILINNDTPNGKGMTSSIWLLSYDGKNRKVIDQTEYIFDDANSSEDGVTFTGETIYYCGAMKDVIYYQILKMESTIPELAQSAEIIQATLTDERITKKTVLSKENEMQIFVSGTKDMVVLSEYGHEKPVDEAGKIYLNSTKDNTPIVIKEIGSGNDIRECMMITPSQCAIVSVGGFCLVDISDGTYQYLPMKRDDDGSGLATVQLGKEGIFYVRTEGYYDDLRVFLCYLPYCSK